MTAKLIAREMGVSHETVRKHLAAIREITGFRKCIQIVSVCRGDGFFKDWQDQVAKNIPLTARERAVLEMLVRGLSAKEISRLLDISPATVAKHRENILRKCGRRRVIDLLCE